MKSLLLAVAVVLSSSAALAQTAEKFHNSGPGRPVPMPQGPRGPQAPPARPQVMLDAQELTERLARMERLLEDAYERSEEGRGRGKLRRAMDELNDVQRMVSTAPSSGGYQPQPQPPPPPPAPVVQPIPEARLRKLTEAMARESFAREKLVVLRDASQYDNFLVGQTRPLLEQFAFSNDKLEAIRILWPRVLDRNNSFQLYEMFTFSSDKEKLRRIIGG